MGEHADHPDKGKEIDGMRVKSGGGRLEAGMAGLLELRFGMMIQ